MKPITDILYPEFLVKTELPVNEQAALFKYAEQQNLGCPTTNEWAFVYDGRAYLAQAYVRGIVYMQLDDLNSLAWVEKPKVKP
jgi:hypothetical protein